MSAMRKSVRFFTFPAILGCIPLLLVVLVMLVATGCSSGSRRKSRPLTITTTSLPDGYDGQTGYNATLAATGGAGTYTWQVVSGSLPPNLNLDSSTGEISGDIASNASPNSPYNFTIEVSDGQQTKQADLSITVHAQLQITTTSLPGGYGGQTGYSATLTATGGTGTYTWSLTGGTLPANLTWDAATATISGDIAAGTTGDYPLQFEVSDGIQTATANLTLTVSTQLQITTTTLPNATEGVAYNYTVTASGGNTSNYTWSVSGQPSWLSIDSSTGELSGTPPTGSAGKTYTFTVTVDDGQQTAQANLSIAVWPKLQITTTSLPDGYEGQTGYLVTLTATGGAGTYTWSLTSGNLPSNLTWDAATATISGDIATATAGDYPLQFEVSDGTQTVTANLTLTVYAQLQITTTSLPDGYEGISYSYTVQAAGGNTSNYDWSVSGQPSWLSINAITGELSGTPPSGSAGNTYTFTVMVDDGLQSVSKRFDLVVGSTPVPPEAEFEASLTYGTVPLTVTFTDKCTGSITQWEWDFDNDGTVDSTQQSPTHTYNNPGWYTVKLTVTGPVGSDSCVKEMYVLAASSIYYVDGVNGDDGNGGTSWNDAFATIGKALSVAGDYDLVLVADATYNETDLNFNGKKIYLKGVDHNTTGAQPVIDCQSNGRAFVLNSGETEDCVIDDFIIQNGRIEDGGAGAIVCDGSSPTIVNCVFQDNGVVDVDGKFSGERGGAIRCVNSSDARIINCVFSGNSATGGGWRGDGGAISCESSNPSIMNCIFINNRVDVYGGAIYCEDSSPIITNCLFSGNSTQFAGGAIACYGGSPTINNCTFSGNSAVATSGWGGGGAIECEGSCVATLNNCILWGNTSNSDGREIWATASTVTLNYCCVDNSAGAYLNHNATIDDSNNCIHSDPEFVNAAGGDYHLNDTSPCIDAGNNSLVPSGVTTDLDGNQRVVDGDNNGTATVDIGAYEYQLCITTTSLPDAIEGVAYSFTLHAIGGNSSNYNWSVSGQPSWLSIDATTGELSGTPPSGSAGTHRFTVEVTDGQCTANKQFNLMVKPAGSLVITTTSLADAREGASYSARIEATGGATPYTWSVSGLPSGLSWSQVGDSVEISGRPAAGTAGTYNIGVTVTDSSSPTQSASATLQLVVNSAGSGTTWYVDGANGSDTNGGTGWSDAFATIGKALSMAADGDTILVADATYNETNLNFKGKNIHLEGVDYHSGGLTRPVIDCQFNDRAFYFDSGETKDCIVDNFVIKNGGADEGGAIYCSSSNPTIMNCIFWGNESLAGGAIFCGSSSPSIINCVFRGNDAIDDGGAIFFGASDATVTNCTFSGNSASVICCIDSDVTLNNCILWDGGYEVYVVVGYIPTLNYCCVDAKGLSGNATLNNCIHDDPQFVDPANGDYHLKDTSPCVDAGDNGLVPSGVDKDLDGKQRIVDGDSDGTATVDIGAYEHQP